MALKKITYACIGLFATGMFLACNAKPDKSGMDTQSSRAPSSSTSGNDTSHTNSHRRAIVSGKMSPPPKSADPYNSNGSTTGQGTMGADSIYQKKAQKSQH